MGNNEFGFGPGGGKMDMVLEAQLDNHPKVQEAKAKRLAGELQLAETVAERLAAETFLTVYQRKAAKKALELFRMSQSLQELDEAELAQVLARKAFLEVMEASLEPVASYMDAEGVRISREEHDAVQAVKRDAVQEIVREWPNVRSKIAGSLPEEILSMLDGKIQEMGRVLDRNEPPLDRPDELPNLGELNLLMGEGGAPAPKSRFE